jgi:hypothetical protein
METYQSAVERQKEAYMKAQLFGGRSRVTAIALLLAWVNAASGQTFSSGSTGADGAFNPQANQTITVRAGGVYNYTTVNIPSFVTLTYVKGTDNAPLTILATGNVTIAGHITVNGNTGNLNFSNPIVGGLGGPGGFNGGMNGGSGFVPTAGEGPGGGAPSSGAGGLGGTYAAPTSFVGLTPLFGGSGGGGGAVFGSGGGGGGAILIASSTKITIDGSIKANGGTFNGSSGCTNFGGSGAGGAIRLVAPDIAGGTLGLVQALGGPAVGGCGSTATGSIGRIRVEASNFAGFTGQTNPVPSVANAPGPVSPAGSPSLVNVPTLAIASIGGLAVPTTPTGSYSVPDLTLASGTANPISVVINATNTPVAPETQINVRVISRSPGTVSTVIVPAANHTGSFASSSATVNVTLPAGQITLLQAFATMTLTGQTASLFPLIDGEPVERVMVAASPGEPSTVSLVTKSGKEIRVDQLRPEDQVRVAAAWEAMRATRVE